RLVRQLTLECLLLGAAGTITGVFLAWAATTALVNYESRQIPRAAEIRIDASVLWFTCAVGLLTIVLFGVMPALRASRADVAGAIKDIGRNTGGRARQSFRKLLVTAELALAFVLVIGAGLLGRSFLRLTGVNPGYDPHNVLTMGVNVYSQRYLKAE